EQEREEGFAQGKKDFAQIDEYREKKSKNEGNELRVGNRDDVGDGRDSDVGSLLRWRVFRDLDFKVDDDLMNKGE
ncbi:hypothetical protein A2U01_0063542, partial [Trifolium medium]|nr:hypothetical protein [Trifolium medium]